MRNVPRMILAFTCVLSLGAAGCGDDGGDDDDDDDVTIDAAGDDDDDVVDAAAGEAPVIESVAWTAAADCAPGTPGDFDVVVTVSDADTSTDALEISGSVSSCTGQINSESVTISCPNAAPYPGNVTVTDPEGHEDTVSFTVSPCEDGTEP